MNNNYNNNFIEPTLSPPVFVVINNSLSTSLIDTAAANFFRTSLNTNVALYVPLGNMTFNGLLWQSADMFLPPYIFNKKKELSYMRFLNNTDLTVSGKINCNHDIVLQCKINKSDGNNFINQREIRVTLVQEDGTIYDTSIFANQQADPGEHEYIILKGSIMHNINDVVKIKINIIQDTKLNDASDSLLTIFLVSWNILLLKNN